MNFQWSFLPTAQPYPLPTKDGGVLRTIGDARAYMLALPKEREWLDHWKAAYRLLVRTAVILCTYHAEEADPYR